MCWLCADHARRFPPCGYGDPVWRPGGTALPIFSRKALSDTPSNSRNSSGRGIRRPRTQPLHLKAPRLIPEQAPPPEGFGGERMSRPIDGGEVLDKCFLFLWCWLYDLRSVHPSAATRHNRHILEITQTEEDHAVGVAVHLD